MSILKAVKSAGKNNVLTSVAMGVAEQGYHTIRYAKGDIDKSEYAEKTAGTVGGTAGGLGGGAAGAAIGSMICPGIGTAIGGVVGCLGGAAAGSTVMKKIKNFFS